MQRELFRSSRGARALLAVLWLQLAVGACGEQADSAGADGTGAGTDAGLLFTGEDDEGNGKHSDAGDTPHDPALTDCAEGLQDNDADGECEPGCDADYDCGQGRCADDTGSVLCLCEPGFAGERCDVCAEGSTGQDCDSCADGFVPSTLFAGACIADPCDAVECGEQGSCGNVDDDAVCLCDLGWAGASCNACADGYVGAACDSCDTGYSSDGAGGCVPDVCVGKDCANGTCAFEPPASAVCECDTGWAVAGEDGSCSVCALGYVEKEGYCVLELPVQHGMLALHLDMMNESSYVLGINKEVLMWVSDTKGGGEKKAIYESDPTAPKQVKVGGLTLLKLDGGQHLRLSDVAMGLESYSVFVAMDPSADGAKNMAALAGVATSDPTKHGFLLRSEQHGTDVRYLHRSPYGTTGGDNVFSGAITDPGVLEPLQVVTAERRKLDGSLVQYVRVDGVEQSASAADPAFGHKELDLLIGMQDDNGLNRFTGRIGEIIIYNGEISLEERAQVEAYLKAKWVPKLGLY